MALNATPTLHFNLKDIGQRLKQIRVEKGISKYQIAKETGMSEGQVTDIEEGRKNYSIMSFLAYCEKVGYAP